MKKAECTRGAKQALLLEELHPKSRAPIPPVPVGLDFPAKQSRVLPSLVPRCFLWSKCCLTFSELQLTLGAPERAKPWMNVEVLGLIPPCLCLGFLCPPGSRQGGLCDEAWRWWSTSPKSRGLRCPWTPGLCLGPSFPEAAWGGLGWMEGWVGQAPHQEQGPECHPVGETLGVTSRCSQAEEHPWMGTSGSPCSHASIAG